MTATKDTLTAIAEGVLRKIASNDVNLMPKALDAFADALDVRTATMSSAEFKALDDAARSWAAMLARIDNDVVSAFLQTPN